MMKTVMGQSLFTYRENFPCYHGWSLEASLKDIGIQEVEASTISLEDDGETYLANKAGRGRLSQLDNLQANQKRSSALIEKIMAKKRILHTEMATIREVLNQLSTQISKYLEVRSRFFSVFKRDVLREGPSRTDVEVIQRGNVSAQCGHITVDAQLFIDGHRNDE